MLKAIHAQESKKAAREKAKSVVEELRSMKLKEAARKVEDGIEETLTYCDFPAEHWTRIRTNNVIERLNREIRRRTRVVGSFPDGHSALMLVCARLRHVVGTQWGNKKYMNMKHLEGCPGGRLYCRLTSFISRDCEPICEKLLTLPVFWARACIFESGLKNTQPLHGTIFSLGRLGLASTLFRGALTIESRYIMASSKDSL